jgi:hypothetical protein
VHPCDGKWQRVAKRARCTTCGLEVMSMKALEVIDPEGFADLVDPEGVQRAFIVATGIESILSGAAR